MELPRLQALWDEYNDQGFEVVAIESNRETERAMQFIENISQRLISPRRGPLPLAIQTRRQVCRAIMIELYGIANRVAMNETTDN